MADEDTDLVSSIKIEGIDTATNDLKVLADTGGSAFDQLAASVKKAGSAISTATGQIVGGFKDVENATPSPKAASQLENIEAAARNVGTAVRSSISGVAQFATTIGALAIAGVGAVAGIAKFAQSVTTAARGASDFSDDFQKQMRLQNRDITQAAAGAAQYQSSINKLNRDVASGAISTSDYSKSVTELKASYQDSLNVQDAVQAAQEEQIRNNEQLQKQASQRQAFNQLADTYGVTLTNALITLGAETDRVRKELVDAFGPVLSNLVDKVTDVIQRNSGTISNFIDTTSKALGDFIDKSGPAMTEIIQFVGTLIKAAFSLIQNQLIPAFASLVDVINTVSKSLGGAFGSEFSAQALIVIALILRMSGAFSTLWSVLTVGATAVKLLIAAFGPWGALITLVAAALLVLATTIDWKKFGADALAAGASIVAFFTQIPARIVGLITQMWASVTAVTASAAGLVTATWQTVLDFFTNLPVVLGLIFTTLWFGITTAATFAATAVIAAWTGFVAFITNLPIQINTLFQAMWDFISAGWTTLITTITDLFTTFTTFLSSLPAAVGAIFTQIGDGIQNAFTNALNFVTSAIQTFVASAIEVIQPLLDMIQAVIAGLAAAAAGGSGDGGGSNFAAGGHVRGPGTSTSDSIRAWLSDGEFVMKTKAVAKYGVAFMRALNDGRIDIGSVIRRAAGGLVSSVTPPRTHFATGGLVRASSSNSSSGMVPLTLVLDGSTFGGLLAPEDVAGSMGQFAISKGAKSAGRKPQWV